VCAACKLLLRSLQDYLKTCGLSDVGESVLRKLTCDQFSRTELFQKSV